MAYIVGLTDRQIGGGSRQMAEYGGIWEDCFSVGGISAGVCLGM